MLLIQCTEAVQATAVKPLHVLLSRKRKVRNQNVQYTVQYGKSYCTIWDKL
jgi:hypothetical protein